MSRTTKAAAAALTVALGIAFVVLLPVDRQRAVPDEFLGRWYLAGSGGGIAGEVHEEATGASIVITEDGKIEQYAPDGSLVSTEELSLTRGASIFSAEEGWIIDSESFVPRVIQADGETLSISDNVYDGFGSWYTRSR